MEKFNHHMMILARDARGMTQEDLAARRAALDQRDLVPFFVVVHLIHERADQEQATSADLLQVAGVGWVGELRPKSEKKLRSDTQPMTLETA